MTNEILTDALKMIDELKTFDRSKGISPFLLVDGHDSRMEFEFLQYINTGVPYGTAIWQVGDSSEQNGSFKTELTRAKEQIVDERQGKCTQAQLHPYDIIPLVNATWFPSFTRVDTNKKAIAQHGWNLLNRNLLLNTEIPATMTKAEIHNGNTSTTIVIPTPNGEMPALDNPPVVDETYFSMHSPHWKCHPNFKTGESAFCIEHLVGHSNLMSARNRIGERERGKYCREVISCKKIVSGSNF